MSDCLQELISDAEIERVHANAFFGSEDKRQVINRNIVSVFCGYHIGGDARRILIDHGLVRVRKNLGLAATKKGRDYAFAVFLTLTEIAERNAAP